MNTANAVSEIALPPKRNFTRFPIAIDGEALRREYDSIPDESWGVSLWDVHCSIDVLLLRGGATGAADDFITENVSNNPILERLPYIASLISPEGPFGGAVYAFIFKTKPGGITRIHRDHEEAWQRAIRIHMPIVTNPGAVLLAEGRSKHLEIGEAWTFDNQSLHSVVNGDATRVHLIIDVNPNPKLRDLLQNATIDPGDLDPERWAKTRAHISTAPAPLEVASSVPLTIAEKKQLDLPADSFATRVSEVNAKGRILGAPLKRDDIVLAVNDVHASSQSRSALDYLHVNCKPGDTVTLTILRNGERIQRAMKLWPDYFLSPRRFVEYLKRRNSTQAQTPNNY